jgi:hypothetical protein
MSDQEQAAVASGNGQSADQTPQELRIPTEADINQMRERGDHEGVRKAVEQLTRISQGEEPQQQVPDAGTPPDDTAGEQPAAKKSFDIKFRGSDKSFDDSDGYLGSGDFGKMKKELAHNRAKLSDVEEQLFKGNQLLDANAQRLRSFQEQSEASGARVKELELRVRELEVENASLKSQGNGRHPDPQPQQPQHSIPEIPEPPVRPELPEDPFDWTPEQRTQNAEYRKKRDGHDKTIAEIMRKLVKGGLTPQQQPSVPQQPKAPQQQQPQAQAPRQSQPQAGLPDDVKEAVEFVKKHKQQAASDQAQKNKDAYWNGFRSFQDKHKELATSIDIEELNNNVLRWMDKLAYANGIDLKAGASDAERSQYEIAKKQLAYKYANGDAQVVANAEACPAPAGYDVYVRLSNLEKLRRKITKDDVAMSDGLHLAWLKSYSEKGMDEDLHRLESQASARGASGVIGALEKHQREHAVTLPNNLPSAPPSMGAASSITSQEIERLLNLSPLEIASSPELAEKRRTILAQIYDQSGMHPK